MFAFLSIKTNECFFLLQDKGDRAYIVTRGTAWKQLCLNARVVKGLKGFNMEGFRDSTEYDKKFIKVLLVAFIGVANIQNGQFDAFAIEFIKGKFTVQAKYSHILCYEIFFLDLFSIRSGGNRIEGFDNMLHGCCDELIQRFK